MCHSPVWPQCCVPLGSSCPPGLQGGAVSRGSYYSTGRQGVEPPLHPPPPTRNRQMEPSYTHTHTHVYTKCISIINTLVRPVSYNCYILIVSSKACACSVMPLLTFKIGTQPLMKLDNTHMSALHPLPLLLLKIHLC